MAGGRGQLVWDRYLSDNLAQGQAIFFSVLYAEFIVVAREMENFARSNHPWQNQTSLAESSFTVRVVGKTTIEAKHGAPYGKWLEFKYGGRWGVIPATLDYGKSRMNQAYLRAWAAAWRFS